MTNTERDKKTIEIIDDLIKRVRNAQLKDVPVSCNDFGNPALNFLYQEVYKSSSNNTPMLALVGAGMFLEELSTELWISSMTHRGQISGKFTTWDELMQAHEDEYEKVENKQTTYNVQIRPALEKILDPEDLEVLELLRDFIRNTFVHSKRTRLLKALQENGVIPKEMPVGKAAISSTGLITKKETVKMSLTHPLVRNIGFQVLARQIAPSMMLFVYDMFRKYHKLLAPLKDTNLKFSGHNCKYD